MPELTPLDDNRQEHFLNGEDLEPITRREHFYAGRESELPAGHQEPETREEWFIQKYRGGGGDVTVVPLSVTENGTYSEEGKAYSPVSVNVPLPTNAYLLKSVANLPQAIASFSDGEEMVMPSLKVAIEPQQDLHGYDSPWVGGAGKNKLENATSLGSRTINGVTITTREDGSLLFNGTSTGGVNFIINSNVQLPDNTYILSTDTTMPTNSIIAVNTSDGNKSTRDSVTFTGSVNGNVWIYVGQEGVVFNNLIIKPMLRLASVQDATFAPYSNICPISGWDDVDLTVADATTDPTVENIYTINLDGTRYGGEVDVVNGIMTVDRVKVDLGNLNYTKNATYPNIFNTTLAINAKNTLDAICEIYTLYSSQTLSQYDYGFALSAGLSVMYIKNKDYAEIDDFKTAMNGVKVVYKLATPTTIQLSPTQVKSLLGSNNVWANTGDIKDAEYFSKEV